MNDHIRFDRDALELHLLDQRLLPGEEADFVCRTPDEVITALQTMVVRGAPAIGVTAAWGCALAVSRTGDGDGWRERLDAALEAIAAARPTAVKSALGRGAHARMPTRRRGCGPPRPAGTFSARGPDHAGRGCGRLQAPGPLRRGLP